VDQPFEPLKFKELMLYVAQRSLSDERFGSVKLNKILFFADVLAFANYGQPITAARYQKQPWGPTARALPPLVDELLRDGDAAMAPRAVFDYTRKALVPLRQPNLELFRGQEIAIVDAVIDSLRGQDAGEVSELTHALVGWKLAELGEDIPYEAVLVDDREATPEQIARGLELAERFDWP
jgi:hypothetical protein